MEVSLNSGLSRDFSVQLSESLSQKAKSSTVLAIVHLPIHIRGVRSISNENRRIRLKKFLILYVSKTYVRYKHI